MRKSSLVVMALMAALAATGCEALIPLAIGEATKDDGPVASESAPLLVEIESVEGSIDGRVIAPDELRALGDRFGEGLEFQLVGQDIQLSLSVASETSSNNPYTGEPGHPGDPGEPIGRPIPVDAGFGEPGLPGGPGASLTVCNGSTCQPAADFTVEIVETAGGRRALIDCYGHGGEQLSIALRYTEAG
ncbi:MAG: hypothetical protein VYE22_38555 [Myxococcota bacterium]|nr:hypothetical protein [Myxococcota bacterium]